MVGGFVGLEQEIKARVLAADNTLFSTDRFVSVDTINLSGDADFIPVLFRHFQISIDNVGPSMFVGGYNYTHHDSAVTISLLYSEAGAVRVLGDREINFNAFVAQDISDIERALLRVFLLDDGTTARMIRQGGRIGRQLYEDTDHEIIRADVTYLLASHEDYADEETVPRFANP
jgi:hypothetical protein